MSINTALKVYSSKPLDQRAVGAGTDWTWKVGEVAGLVRFDTTAGRLKVYDGGEWREIVDSDTETINTSFLNVGQMGPPFLGFQVDNVGNSTQAGTIQCASASCSGTVSINSTTTPGANDAIMFSHGRIQSKGGSGTNMFLESYGGYLVLKSGDKVAIDAANAIYYTTPTSASSMGHYFTGVVFHFNGSNWASDDRLKWEEVPIANGLSVINRLQPQVYWKGNSLDVEPTPTERRRESGFIAQEVEQIPELAHAVIQSVQDDVSNGTYFLDYAQLHAYHVAATQELHTLVGQQRALIEALTSRVAALET